MRHLLQPANESVLTWLIRRDPEPLTLPIFPDDPESRLVVAHLLNGKCYAELVPDAKHLVAICGDDLPLGRLFFHVKTVDLVDAGITLPTSANGGRP